MADENSPEVPHDQPGTTSRVKLFRAFVIALAFGLITNVGAWAFSMEGLLTRLSSFNESIGYGLRSLSAVSLVNEFQEQVSERYMLGLPRGRYSPPRKGLAEGFTYTLACAWNGRDTCDEKFVGAGPRSNWFGKLLVVLTAVVAFAAVCVFIKQEGKSPLWLIPQFPLTLLVFLGFVSAYSTPVGAVHGLLTWLGGKALSLVSAVVTLAAFAPVGLVVAALKDVTTDQLKDYMSRKVFGDGGKKNQT